MSDRLTQEDIGSAYMASLNGFFAERPDRGIAISYFFLLSLLPYARLKSSSSLSRTASANVHQDPHQHCHSTRAPSPMNIRPKPSGPMMMKILTTTPISKPRPDNSCIGMTSMRSRPKHSMPINTQHKPVTVRKPSDTYMQTRLVSPAVIQNPLKATRETTKAIIPIDGGYHV